LKNKLPGVTYTKEEPENPACPVRKLTTIFKTPTPKRGRVLGRRKKGWDRPAGIFGQTRRQRIFSRQITPYKKDVRSLKERVWEYFVEGKGEREGGNETRADDLGAFFDARAGLNLKTRPGGFVKKGKQTLSTRAEAGGVSCR